MKNIATPVLLAAFLAISVLPVAAQPAPGSVASPATPEQAAPRQAQMRERMKDHMLKRSKELKAKLKLRPEQEPAWDSFMAAMKPIGPLTRPSRAEMEQLTTPQRLDKMRELRQQRNAAMDRRMEATKAYYATLTPEQKKIFDAQTLHRPPEFAPGTAR